jgi:hypothetical protein
MSTKPKNESKKERKKQYNFKEVFQHSIFGKKKRTSLRFPRHNRNRRINLRVNLKSRKAKGTFLIVTIVMAMFTGLYFTLFPMNIDVNFKGSKREADVYEEITFNWKAMGNFLQGMINFGDGTSVKLNHSSNSITHSYAVQGKYTPLIHVWNQNGFSASKASSIKIKNYAPKFEVILPKFALEDERVNIRVVNIVESEVDLREGVLRYLYDFADNNQTSSNQGSIAHKWENAGTYPITITLFDDQNAVSQKMEYIEVNNKPPKANFNYNISNDRVEFDAELSFDTESDTNSLMYFWAFGDYHTAFGKYVHHAYASLGEYTVELCVKDDNGETDRFSRVINLGIDQTQGIKSNETDRSMSLDVLGPYTLPQNVEGQVVNLDVEAYDAIENQPNLNYSWHDETGDLISNNARPSILLDDGDYLFTLNVSNQAGQTASEKISLKVNNIAPEVFVSNYVYNGPSKGGEIELEAYGYDTIFDCNKLRFYWEITNGRTNHTYKDSVGKATSTLNFICTETAIYRGQVRVVDPGGKQSVATFFVNVIIDNNKNSVPDNIEQMLSFTGESLETFSDADNDFLSDQYEQSILNTNFVNPDTDNDGLCDGLDASGIGELSLGTNPLNEDSDFDLLKDSEEFYGWNITITTFEGTKEFHVSSEPLNYDSDGDGVSDYNEFQLGSNPRARDSDGDLLDDSIDPFPTNFDQDSDYLSDKIELEIGTGLNTTDSDLDGISDGEEYYGWGVLGFKTDPLDADCDRDFVSDNAEMKFYSVKLENPANNEIRVNVSNPVSLHFPYMFQKAATAQISVALSFGEHGTNQTGEYGVRDSEVTNLTITIRHEGYDIVLFETITNRTRYFSHIVDIGEVMNNASLNYYGNYVLEVDDPKAGCLVEQFEFEFSRYLDPNNEDFDGDGILDGVEMNLLVEGTKKVDVNDTFNSTQRLITSTDTNANLTTTYRLEIPYIGRVFDAQLNFAFESVGPLHNGTILEFELAKKYLDKRKNNYIFWKFYKEYWVDTFERESYTYNLTKLQRTNPNFDQYGEYVVTLSLESPENIHDQINITKFYIETETYVNAGPLDTHAWLTDPALNDTDSDGWSDSYEIFTTHTNPLSDDTDGDGALDPNDRESLKNIILRISPISASYRNQIWPTIDPILKIGMYLGVNDLIDPNGLKDSSKIGFFTNNKKSTTDVRNAGFLYTHETAWWNAGEGTHYYIDINDDFTAQSNSVPFYFTLWESAPLGDINRFDGKWYSDTYDMESPELTQSLNVKHLGGSGRYDEITVEVTKITVEKANTVAIYSKNDTSFNGHYQHQERMNVFQLHITDVGDGTPFVQGVNAIVIPTSLFAKTKLNALIEKGQLDQTVLYSNAPGEFGFYSIDRDGNIVDEECGDVDFVFVRFEMTSQEAMELLDLLLTCAANQSLDKNNQTITVLKTVNSYISTKFNGTNAVMLNIPNTISRFVLWAGGYEDSSYGTKPEPFDITFIWLFVIPFILPLTGLLMLFQWTSDRVNEFNTKNADMVGLTMLTYLANLLWTLIRAALIIVAYIVLALEVLTISIIFLGMGVVLDITSLFSGFDCEWGINWAIPYGVDTKIAFIELEMNDFEVTVEAFIKWTYWEYFDIYFPLLTMDSKLGSIFEDTIGSGSDVSTPPELACGYDHLGGLRYDFHAGYRQRPQGYAPTYVKLVLISPTGNMYNYTMTETPGQSFNSYYSYVRFNRTVDFGQDFDFNERQGQWHYCFITKASVIDTTTRWPSDGYAIGPLFHDNRSYFISSYLDPFSGYIGSEFNFTATGCDFINGLTPQQVNLKVMWLNHTIATFSMNLASTFSYNNMSFNTYSRSLTFSRYISIVEPTTLKYYYEAIFADGFVSVLWDYEVIDESSEEDDYSGVEGDIEYIPCWFEGPLLRPNVSGNDKPPIIWDWYVEDLTWNRLLSNDSAGRVLGPISDEFLLRFWVYVEDPDGTHKQHWNNGFEIVPQLHLVNLNEPEAPLEPIDMRWTGGHYGPGPEGYDEYFVDILGDGHYAYKYEQKSDLFPFNFTSGAWKFAFEVADNQSHVTNETPDKKMWHIGSIENMKNTFFYGHPSGIGVEGIWGSIIISIAYMIMAALASSSNQYVQLAAQILAGTLAVLDIVFNIIAFSNFVFTSIDMGSLLGLGFHVFIKSMGFLIALSQSKNEGGSFSFNLLNNFSGLMLMLIIFDLMDNAMGILWDTSEEGAVEVSQNEKYSTLNEILGGYPMMIVYFLSSIIGLTTSLTIFGGAARSEGGTKYIKIIMIVHTIISVLLSALCFYNFYSKTGFFLIFNDLRLGGA